MKAHKLFTLIQSTKSGGNNRLRQLFYGKDIDIKNQKLVLTQSREPLPQISLNWNFLVKQGDHLWQFFLHFAEISQEPTVTRKQDRQGRSHFQIYNPSTGTYHYFNSEQDTLVWLDRDRFGKTSQSLHQNLAESSEKVPDKNLKSFDYFGRRF